MYCNHCGTKLEDGARFCPECGAPVSQDAPAQPVKEDSPIAASVGAAGAYPPSAQPTADPGPTAPPQGACPTAPMGAQGAYPGPAAPQGAYPPPSGTVYGAYPPPPQGNANAPAGMPTPAQPPMSTAQSPYPYSGQGSSAGGAPQKKKRGPLIAALVILGVILAAVILLVVFFKLRYEEPPLPALTEATSVAEPEAAITDADTTGSDAAGTTTTETTTAGPEQPSATAAPTENDGETHAAVLNVLLTDEQTQAVKEKTVGFWNSPDKKTFIGVTRMDQGLYYFQHGYWYSEADYVGYLQQPAKGDPDGTVSVHLYFEGFESGETGYSMPSIDADILFDFSRLDEGVLWWNFSGEWEDFTYGGATMEEAMPSFEQVFGEE